MYEADAMIMAMMPLWGNNVWRLHVWTVVTIAYWVMAIYFRWLYAPYSLELADYWPPAADCWTTTTGG